jgi:hypothetical protein
VLTWPAQAREGSVLFADDLFRLTDAKVIAIVANQLVIYHLSSSSPAPFIDILTAVFMQVREEPTAAVVATTTALPVPASNVSADLLEQLPLRCVVRSGSEANFSAFVAHVIQPLAVREKLGKEMKEHALSNSALSQMHAGAAAVTVGAEALAVLQALQQWLALYQVQDSSLQMVGSIVLLALRLSCSGSLL